MPTTTPAGRTKKTPALAPISTLAGRRNGVPIDDAALYAAAAELGYVDAYPLGGWAWRFDRPASAGGTRFIVDWLHVSALELTDGWWGQLLVAGSRTGLAVTPEAAATRLSPALFGTDGAWRIDPRGGTPHAVLAPPTVHLWGQLGAAR